MSRDRFIVIFVTVHRLFADFDVVVKDVAFVATDAMKAVVAVSVRARSVTDERRYENGKNQHQDTCNTQEGTFMYRGN